MKILDIVYVKKLKVIQQTSVGEEDCVMSPKNVCMGGYNWIGLLLLWSKS